MTAINGSGFSNPYRQITAGQQGVADAQRRTTEGILGESTEAPSDIRHDMFKSSALIGQARNRESYEVQQRQSDKEALADTNNAAKPAE